ncbi:MAG: alpha/beta hydrolase [Nitrospira sp.]|nr:alpha/beta hydrolase [Nitrospira sp.]
MNVVINGISLAYSDHGKGLPLIFLHAFPLNRTMWEPQVEALSTEFRTITVDLRGHGESDAPLWRYTLDQAADDVAALMDHLSIDQAALVGLSMGGYILFAFYRRYANRVKGLVLANTRAQADTEEGKQLRFRMAQIAYRQGPAVVADLMIPKLLSPLALETKPTLVQKVRAIIERTEVSGIAGDLMAMAERPDSIPLLRSMTCPVHIIAGEMDQATPPADAQLMADCIPHSHLTIIAGAGHLSNLEQPDDFNQAVRKFARTLAVRGAAG